jgi:tetratricopeptide (TPR) repeat protein
MVTRRDAARWAFHDLLRAYADELAHSVDSAAEVREARHRMLDHYLHTAHLADRQLDRHRDPTELPAPVPGVQPEALSDHDSAMSWYTCEHSVLLTVLNIAAESGFDRHAWHLAWVMGGYFERRGHWNEWVSTQTLALAAAERADDHVGQVRAHRSLARAHVRLGRHAEARPHLDTALRLYERLDDPVGEAYTHLNLNIVFEEQGRYREALYHATNALRLYEAAGHLVGQGLSLNGIGWSHAHLGDYAEALRCCEQALALQQRVGHKSGESDTWDSIGFAYLGLKDYARASHAYRQALRLFCTLGDRYNEATSLLSLGEVAQLTGDSATAAGHWQVASEILDELGHPDLDRVRAKLRQAQVVPPPA